MEENKRGRKLTVNVKENKNYYNEYYHRTNKLVKCSCGQDVFSRSFRVHQKSKRHSKLSELLKKAPSVPSNTLANSEKSDSEKL